MLRQASPKAGHGRQSGKPGVQRFGNKRLATIFFEARARTRRTDNHGTFGLASDVANTAQRLGLKSAREKKKESRHRNTEASKTPRRLDSHTTARSLKAPSLGVRRETALNGGC